MTFTILTTSDGVKMGKTQNGAVWLDPEKTSPYEFFQYWRNVEDTGVGQLLGLLTFLPMDEVNRLSALEGKEINTAKEILAFELTKIVHGEEEATKAMEAAKALFGDGPQAGSIPTTMLSKADVEKGINIIELLEKAELIPSRGEGRRLIIQGGIKINDEKVDSHEAVFGFSDFKDNELMIQKGKKVFHRIELL